MPSLPLQPNSQDCTKSVQNKALIMRSQRWTPCFLYLFVLTLRADDVEAEDVYFPKTANTIYALSTPVGVGGRDRVSEVGKADMQSSGIAVVRISGEDALAALQKISKAGGRG
eukprot:756323-Hanusia_phi.AAC.3